MKIRMEVKARDKGSSYVVELIVSKETVSSAIGKLGDALRDVLKLKVEKSDKPDEGVVPPEGMPPQE